MTRAWAEITRTKEIVPETAAGAFRVAAQVHIIRHGETQGYSTESGLTPLGGWQAHRRGFDLSKGIRDGEQVQIVCADTNRARQTAEHLHRGLLDGLDLWRRDAKVAEPRPMAEFRNFQVATPDGLRDVTSAFRMYHALMPSATSGSPSGTGRCGWSRWTGSGGSSRAGPTPSTTG